jgi:glutamine cyclotransferase
MRRDSAKSTSCIKIPVLPLLEQENNMRRSMITLVLLLTIAFFTHTAFAQTSTPPAPDTTPELTPEITPEATTPALIPIEVLQPKVLNTYPHDTAAYTEGLLLHDGFLYESTGEYGQSDIRKVELKTGKVLQKAPNAAENFGEGLALVDDHLIQLKNGQSPAKSSQCP